MDNKKTKENISCSICKREKNNSLKIMHTNNNINVCQICINNCYKIFKETKLNENINFSIKDIKKIFDMLNEYVVGQHEAKRILSVAINNHIKRCSYNKNKNDKIDKSNILLIGPTGCGKTFLIKILSSFSKIPFSVSDATSITETGYVGDDVESIIYKLYVNSNFNKEKTERGIVFLDEVDKIAKKSDNLSITRDVSGEGVQQALLKLIEGSEVFISKNGNKRDLSESQVKINTENILFIFGGSFFGINSLLKSSNKIGFHENKSDNKKNKDYSSALLKFGLIPEIIGRIPIIVELNKLTKRDLKEIIFKSKNSIINQYKILFNIDNIKLLFHEDALDEIAEISFKKNVGARGIRSVVDNILTNILFDISYLKELKKIKEIIINKNTVKFHLNAEIVFNNNKYKLKDFVKKIK